MNKNERFYKIEKPKTTFPEKPLISVVESDSNKIALNNLISMPLQLKDKQNSVSFSQNTLEKPSQKLSSYKVTKVIEDPPLSSPHSHLKEVQKSKIKKLETKTTNKTFQEIEKQCTQYLYNYLEKEKRFLTSELTERISLQAERAANFIYHAHTVKGTNPTVEQTKLFLLRAKYEQ